MASGFGSLGVLDYGPGRSVGQGGTASFGAEAFMVCGFALLDPCMKGVWSAAYKSSTVQSLGCSCCSSRHRQEPIIITTTIPRSLMLDLSCSFKPRDGEPKEKSSSKEGPLLGALALAASDGLAQEARWFRGSRV